MRALVRLLLHKRHTAEKKRAKQKRKSAVTANKLHIKCLHSKQCVPLRSAHAHSYS